MAVYSPLFFSYPNRYLSHVPVTCAFEVVEIELSGSLSKEVRSKFSGQVEARRARRQKRARDERRRERKIKVAENKIMGKYTGPRRNLHLESEVHFPGFPGNSTLDQARGNLNLAPFGPMKSPS